MDLETPTYEINLTGGTRGLQGPEGKIGPQGKPGPQGEPGMGVPDGGEEGQTIIKQGNATIWDFFDFSKLKNKPTKLSQFNNDTNFVDHTVSNLINYYDKNSTYTKEEINQMILDNDLRRREDMIQLEMKYRKEMADAAAQLAQIMANIQVEARSKILTLYTNKEKEYLDLQAKYKQEMFETVKNLRETFPDGSGNDIIKDEIRTQFEVITNRSVAFSTLMNEDIKKVFSTIDDGMKEITGLATKYFQPVQSNQSALTQNVIDSIEHKTE